MTGKLYLTATPIGNLGDITHRAAEVLGEVDLVACEDTRHTRKLLSHLGIQARTVSYHAHNEAARTAELIAMLEEGRSIAVVSDAGTPGIADPGMTVVREAIARGIEVVPVPGAAAFVAAATASGLPAAPMFFEGFLPARQGERRRRLAELAGIPATLVFYEAPHRLARSLADCAEVLGDREAAVARELTKLHEEFVRGRLAELARRFADGTKGEIVVVVGAPEPEAVRPADEKKSVATRVEELLAEGMDRRAAMKQAAREFGLSRSEVYREVEAGKAANAAKGNREKD